MNGIIWLVGAVVIIVAILGYIGIGSKAERAWSVAPAVTHLAML